MDERGGREIWFLNRDLLVVRPRAPYAEWARSVYDDEGVAEPEDTLEWVTSFLLPQFEFEDDAMAWLAENCDVIFEMMLNDWLMVPELWPEDRGWEAFQRWFSFERIETAWDLVDAPLSSDPPPPAWEGPMADA